MKFGRRLRLIQLPPPRSCHPQAAFWQSHFNLYRIRLEPFNARQVPSSDTTTIRYCSCSPMLSKVLLQSSALSHRPGDLNSSTDIYQTEKNFNKGKTYAPMNQDASRTNMVFAPNKKEHGRRRRIIRAGFTDSAVRRMTPMTATHFLTFCDQMLDGDDETIQAGTWARPKDMEQWCMSVITPLRRLLTSPVFWLGQDINTDPVVGRSFNLLTSDEMRKPSSVMQDGSRRSNLVFQYPYLFRPGLNHPLDFGTWFIPSVMDKLTQFTTFASSCALSRLRKERPPSLDEQMCSRA